MVKQEKIKMLKLSNGAIIALMVFPYFSMKYKMQFLFKINRHTILPKFLPKNPPQKSFQGGNPPHSFPGEE